MNISIGNKFTVLCDIHHFSYDGVELAIMFKPSHRYSSMEEIMENIPGVEEYNFYFKGVNAWEYDRNSEFPEDGETSLLAVVRNVRINVSE